MDACDTTPSPPPLNPEQLASELLKQTSATDAEHLRSAKLHHLTSFIASRSSSMCTAGSHSPISPNIYRALMHDDASSSETSSKQQSKSGSVEPDGLLAENEEESDDEKV